MISPPVFRKKSRLPVGSSGQNFDRRIIHQAAAPQIFRDPLALTAGQFVRMGWK